MNDTTTIRISKETYETVKAIAQQQNQKIYAVVEQAVKDLKKKYFFDNLNSDYARLKGNPAAWSEERTERQEWDAVLTDGLENANEDK
jgi:predicted transcriptional regulator